MDSTPIPIVDAAYTLCVLESDINNWIDKDKPILVKDSIGRLCVPEDFVNKCASNPGYKEAVRKAIYSEIRLRINDETSNQNENFREQRLSLLNEYNKYIKDLQELHLKYIEKIDILNNENGLVAAYILFFKAISLLWTASDCIKVGQWFSGSFLREIDETLDLAHYFIIAENATAGKKHLRNWFRLNKAPKNKTCREAISKWEYSINPQHSEADYKILHNELYYKKSKWIHPTLNLIREGIIFEESNGEVIAKGFDYRTCGYERKLFEYTQFLKSSIWSAYQDFMICFRDKMPLEKADIEFILDYDKLFNNLD